MTIWKEALDLLDAHGWTRHQVGGRDDACCVGGAIARVQTGERANFYRSEFFPELEVSLIRFADHVGAERRAGNYILDVSSRVFTWNDTTPETAKEKDSVKTYARDYDDVRRALMELDAIDRGEAA